MKLLTFKTQIKFSQLGGGGLWYKWWVTAYIYDFFPAFVIASYNTEPLGPDVHTTVIAGCKQYYIPRT